MAQDLRRSQTNVPQSAQSGTAAGVPSRRQGDLWSQLNAHPDDFFRMNPFQLMRHFSDEMDRMWSGYGRERRQNDSMTWRPAVDVRERDGQLMVNVELPGVKENDVKVAIENDMLVIQGERRQEQSHEDEGVYRSELSYGSFYRAIPLPEGAESDKANARFNNGLLEITLPVPKSRQSVRQIPISTTAQGTQDKTVAQDKVSRAGGS